MNVRSNDQHLQEETVENGRTRQERNNVEEVFQHDDKGSKQTRKVSSGLSRLSEEIIQTSQQMKEKRLRSETAQKTREETEVRKANERIATTTALTVVQQEHDAQKVRQEEHDVDHMTKQRQDQITQEQAMTSQSHPSHAAGGACWRSGRRVAVRRQEQLGVSSSGAKDLPQGLAEGIFASSDGTRRWTCLLREQHKHGRSTRLQQKQAPPDM